MTKIRKTAIAAMTALTLVPALSVANPGEAQAGGKAAAALIGGAIIGGIIASHARPVYAAPVYQTSCWYENKFVGYDAYGRQVFQKTQVCG